MPFITFEKPNQWEEACYEVRTGLPKIPLPPGGITFNSAVYSPVFAGYAYQPIQVADASILKDFDAACAHPSTAGYSMTVLTKEEEKKEIVAESTVSKDKAISVSPTECSAVTYLTTFIFPTITAALESMLVQAKSERCFERKRTKFNACDFLTEYLYKKNPAISEEEREKRSATPLFEIPFARDWLVDHPRKPLPLSLIWTEEQAATMLQSAWRGYLLRRQPEIQELRKWQRDWREENRRVLDGEIDKLFSRAQSQASSTQSPRSRPSSRRLSAQRRRSGKRQQSANNSTPSGGVQSDGSSANQSGTAVAAAVPPTQNGQALPPSPPTS